MKTWFPDVPAIPYEGPESTNPLAFRHYDAGRVLQGRTMAEHLRFAVCYWHSFCGTGSDPFGPGTRRLPWNDSSDPMQQARDRLDAAFEFVSKLGAPFWCFHDRDLAPEGADVEESERNLAALVERARAKQAETGLKLLWGTANLFSHPRYMNGAATNPDFQVVCHAAAQVRAALHATQALGGENYVFWGGREGYQSLLHTDMKRERENLATFLRAAVRYAHEIGFTGTFLIEPKPMEPSKHQYDFDAATVLGFLREFDIQDHFKLNIEANHATLAGHSFAHDLQVAADAGMLGSIDANRGDPQNGWDTDQFPTNLYDCVEAMLVVLRAGGFTTGGLNFDAKVRRTSTDLVDLFYGHIGAMDAFARALEIAQAILDDGVLDDARAQRYASFDHGPGADFRAGTLDLHALRNLALESGEPALVSGRQEWFENLVNRYLF